MVDLYYDSKVPNYIHEEFKNTLNSRMLSIRNSLSKSLKSGMYVHTLNSRILSIRNSLSKSLKNEIYLHTFLALREFTLGIFALMSNNKM